MWLFLWDSEPSKIFVGDTPISKVFLWDTQVRPSGWKPWANTIAYYPLTSTTQWTDQSWNWFDLTNWWWVSFGMYGWVDCWYFTGKNCLKTSSWNIINNWQTTFTWLSRMYFIDGGSWNPRLFTNTSQSDGLLVLQNDQGKISVWSSGWNTWLTYQTWWWHLYAISWDYLAWTFTGYVDINSTSWTWSGRNYGSWLCVWWTNSISDIFNWYMSEVIFENKIRTTQELADYYNQTRANYWIS